MSRESTAASQSKRVDSSVRDMIKSLGITK